MILKMEINQDQEVFNQIQALIFHKIRENARDIDREDEDDISQKIVDELDNIIINSGFAGAPRLCTMNLNLTQYYLEINDIKSIGLEIVTILQESYLSTNLHFRSTYNRNDGILVITGIPTHYRQVGSKQNMTDTQNLLEIIKTLHLRMSRLESSIFNCKTK